MKLTRRGMLLGVAALGLLPRPALASQGALASALLALLSDQESAAKLGGVWLKQGSQHPDAVLSDLETDLRRQGWTGGSDRNALGNAVAAAVTEDFSAGHIVSLEGWQIARTQAQLCALAYFASVGSL